MCWNAFHIIDVFIRSADWFSIGQPLLWIFKPHSSSQHGISEITAVPSPNETGFPETSLGICETDGNIDRGSWKQNKYVHSFKERAERSNSQEPSWNPPLLTERKTQVSSRNVPKNRTGKFLRLMSAVPAGWSGWSTGEGLDHQTSSLDTSEHLWCPI